MTQYDTFAQEYDQTVSSRPPVIERSYQYVLDHLNDVTNTRVCDLGCGQGELSRRIADLGARVTGVDFSAELLNIAERYPSQHHIQWVHDDAQSLYNIEDEQFDVVVANLMLMDVPDYKAVFHSAFRILVPGGAIIWTIMHPCFQSPHSEPAADEDGVLRFRTIKTYKEQWWKSGGADTIRGTLGAYHRPLSHYINGFLSEGFCLRQMAELTIPREMIVKPQQTPHTFIPPILGVTGTKTV